MIIEEHDTKLIHCRMLGHEVPFGYCRKGATGQACRKIFDCWFKTFDVEAFMRSHYTDAQITAILAPPKDKIETIVDLIQKTQGG